MRSSTLLQLALASIVAAAPTPQVATSTPPATPPPTTPAAPGTAAPAPGGLPAGLPAGLAGLIPPGLDLSSILGPGTDLASLIPPGLDIGALLNGALGPDANADTVVAGYKSVTEKNNALVKAIEAIPATGDATAALNDVLAKAKNVNTALKTAGTAAGGIQIVGLGGSIGLGQPGDEVTASFAKAADALVAKKDAIIKAGQKAQFLEVGKSLKADVDAWTKAINAKLPSMSLPSAELSTQASLAAADKIIAAFT
ncbi:hypothetical protein EJ08DRAFT_196883 [Tothia fuscella]|uniref:Uncharacterized protein n=1 Tax=Tothia fuscella TaxID=1048955 RepID=A0A9P4TY45_9PEZI|nr:hypothetical protein EJ08DRAFT_196883 [Tothia fuscella]